MRARLLLVLTGLAATALLTVPGSAMAVGEPGMCPAVTISGTPVAGQQLTASNSVCTLPAETDPPGPPIYQWQSCDATGANCVNRGTNSPAFTPGAADINRRIKVTRTARNLVGSTPVTSGLTPAIAADPPTIAGLPTFSPTSGIRPGQTLTKTSDGAWNDPDGDPPEAFTRGWVRCNSGGGDCTVIATGPSYTVTAADVGSTMRLRVVATGSYGVSSATDSAPSTVVLPPVAGGGGGSGGGGGGSGGSGTSSELLSPFPVVVIAGRIGRRGTAISGLVIRAPKGSRVTVRCRGRGCPFRKRSKLMRTKRLRIRSLRGRLYRPGTKITVSVTKRGKIGKFTRFTVRRGRPPKRRDLCLKPGARKPSGCPSA